MVMARPGDLELDLVTQLETRLAAYALRDGDFTCEGKVMVITTVSFYSFPV
jgi:hypothetical protein